MIYYVEVDNGNVYWCKDPEMKIRHREGGPAVECADGDKYWYLNGMRHREDGPAIEYANGTKYWHQNGKLHREDGPAIEYPDGTKVWYQNGKYHREDGPAIEYADGEKEYWYNGKKLTEAEFLSCTNGCDGKIVEIDGKKYQLKAV